MSRPIAPGAGVALLTLFDEERRLLAEKTADFAATLVEAGAASALVGGTVGEFYELDDQERLELVAAVRRSVPSNVPVIAHVGGIPVERAAALARKCRGVGADALLALPPAARELQAAYYARIVEVAGEVPVLAYHLPQGGRFVALDDLMSLGVSGIKDSSGDASRLATTALSFTAEVYTGAALLLGLAGALDAAGAFLGVANVAPKPCVLALSGDRAAQTELARLVVEGDDDFPGSLKRMAAERWGIPVHARTPPDLAIGELPWVRASREGETTC